MESKLKRYMAVYTGTAAALEQWKREHADPKKREAVDKAGMQAWMKWGETHAKAILDNGGPLGRTKRVTREGIAAIRNNLAAYTIVQAESHEAAAKLFLDHPHFTIFPGDGVEIMELLPLPKMP